MNRSRFAIGRRRRSRGMTLVELMVALVIGLLLVIAMSALFVANSVSRREVGISADAIESGRYAMDELTRELSQAGFYGTLTAPTGTTNNPCSTTLTDWQSSLAIYVMGWNSAPASFDANPTCLNRKPGTDAVWIQRASTCFVGEAGCEAESNANAYLQVSECGTEYLASPFVVAQGGDTASFSLQTNKCDGTKAVKRKLIRRIYYITNADKLASIDINLTGPQPSLDLVDNIEQMQIEYGIDTDGDGTVDSFVRPPLTTVQWAQVMGMRVWIIARSEESSKNTSSVMKFPISDYAANPISLGTANTPNQKRRAYSSYISFATPQARLEQ